MSTIPASSPPPVADSLLMSGGSRVGPYSSVQVGTAVGGGTPSSFPASAAAPAASAGDTCPALAIWLAANPTSNLARNTQKRNLLRADCVVLTNPATASAVILYVQGSTLPVVTAAVLDFLVAFPAFLEGMTGDQATEALSSWIDSLKQSYKVFKGTLSILGGFKRSR